MNALGWPLGAVEIINSNQAIKVICAREKGDGIEIKKNIYIYIYIIQIFRRFPRANCDAVNADKKEITHFRKYGI
jgi:hypothetical protein